MTKIAIIGGGCAGLGAAYTLLQRIPGNSDHRVVLYEAFDRLGGRAWTRNLGGIDFDLGPQFIQDPVDNPWVGIIQTLNQWRPNQQFNVIQPQIDSKWRVNTAENGWQTLGVNGDAPPNIQSNSDLVTNGFDGAADIPNRSPLYKSLGNQQEAQLGQFSTTPGAIGESVEAWQYIASDSSRQVAVVVGAEQNNSNKYVTQGIGTMVSAFGDYLQATYPDTFKVLTGRTISKLEQTAGEIKIGTADEQEDSGADYCIVTASTTTLQNIAFIPPFTYDRNKALSYVRLGSYKKVAFIPDEMPEGIAENTEYYFFDGQGCWQYFRLPTNSALLIGVTAGNYAAVLDRLDDAPAAQRFVQALNTAYGAQMQLPQNYIVTNWSRQLHVRGAYSFTRYDGGDPNDPFPLSARQVIAQSIGKIHFAGEATWTDAYGTIHGAYRSGERAANAVLDAIGL